MARRVAETIIPSLALEPPPETCRVEFRTVAAPAGDLHGIVPDRRLEYVRGSSKAVLCVLHVTAPSPAARQHSRARQAAINDRGSRPRVPWQHQFEDARGVPSSQASPSPGRIAGHQQRSEEHTSELQSLM